MIKVIINAVLFLSLTVNASAFVGLGRGVFIANKGAVTIAAPGFSPFDIVGSSVTSWYDANDGPSPAVNGSTVTVWTDRGLTNSSLAQANGNAIIYTNYQNGLPAVYFNGASDLSTGDSTNANQPTTMFVVFKPTAWATGTYQVVAQEYGGQTIGKNTGVTNTYISAVTVLQGDSIGNNTTVLTALFNGANSSVRVNADAAVTGNAGVWANVNNPIMGSSYGANYFTGYIMEWIVYEGQLSADDQTLVRNYLNSKWAIY